MGILARPQAALAILWRNMTPPVCFKRRETANLFFVARLWAVFLWIHTSILPEIVGASSR